jgi:hypothetical protein
MWNVPLFSIALLLARLVITTVAPAAAQAQQQPAAGGLPSNERLDALVAAKKWNELADALAEVTDAEQFTRKLDWLKGEGRSNPSTDPDKDLRVTAAFMLLYTYALIAVDGVKCEDQSAPGHRLDQVLEMDVPVLKFLKARARKLKDKLIAGAINYEKFTAPLRKDDDVMCRGGLHEIMAGLEHGTTHEEPTTTGQAGQSIAVQAPPDYAPEFLAPKAYQPLQVKARSLLKSNMTVLAR